MGDPRLRRTQLVALLKKRTYISDNELYEMMRSRQVYHVQTELRKELDRTIKALQNAEKIKVAGFMTQKAMFMKKVDKRERGLRHLIDVQAKMNDLPPHGLSGDSGDSNYLDRKLWFQDLSRVDFDTANSDQTNMTLRVSLENDQSNAKVLYSKDDQENMWDMPTVNTEWMVKMRELPKGVEPTKKVSDILLSRYRRFERSREEEIIQPPQETADRHTNAVPIIQNNPDPPDTLSSIAKNRSEKTSGKENKIKDNVTEFPLISMISEEKKQQQQQRSENKVQTLTLPRIENKNDNGHTEEHASQSPPLSQPIADPPKLSNDAAAPDSADGPFCKSMEVRKTGPIAPDGQTRSSDNNLIKENQEYIGGCNRNNHEAKKPLVDNAKKHISTKSERDTRELSRQKPFQPKLPYLQRSKSHPTVEIKVNRKIASKSRPLPGDLERTVTMIFVEDRGNSPKPPKSQFDFEAWLAYNRRKRGHTQILNEIPYSEIGRYVEDKAKTLGHKKKGSKNNSRVSFSRDSKIPNQRPPNPRERSKEWYKNFLKIRHDKRKCSDHLEHTKSDLSFPSRYGLLPKINEDTNSGTSKSAEMASYKKRTEWTSRSHQLAMRESTDQKLKRLKDQSKTLQLKVQNFIYS